MDMIKTFEQDALKYRVFKRACANEKLSNLVLRPLFLILESFDKCCPMTLEWESSTPKEIFEAKLPDHNKQLKVVDSSDFIMHLLHKVCQYSHIEIEVTETHYRFKMRPYDFLLREES